ncbi:hypothetical protein ABBQ38_002118 [Trebouxia sp. C0009 RCD-2024]
MPAALRPAVFDVNGVRTGHLQACTLRPPVAHNHIRSILIARKTAHRRFSSFPGAGRRPCSNKSLTVAAASDKDLGFDNSRNARLQRTGRASSHLVQESWKLLKAHVWPIILIFILCDCAIFLNNRISHRLTNEVARRLLQLSPADISPNPWYLAPNPASRVFSTAYPYLMGFMFLASFPFTILARTIATSAVALLCCQHPNTESGNNAAGPTADAESSDARTAAVSSDAPQAGASTPPPNATNTPSQTFRGVRATLGHMVSTVQLLQPGVSAVWKRAFVVDMLVTLQVLPLQVASLLLVTLPWTLPRLLDLQAANPVAVLDGQEGRKALDRSKQLVQPLRAAVALPFLGLILFTRILTPLKGRLLAALPMRYYRELPEVPIALYFAFTVLAVIIHRMHDLLPVVVYQQGQQHDGASTTVSSQAT